MVGWHHQFNGQEYEQTPGDSEGQENLACCSPLSRKELDITECLNNNSNNLRMGARYENIFIQVNFTQRFP